MNEETPTDPTRADQPAVTTGTDPRDRAATDAGPNATEPERLRGSCFVVGAPIAEIDDLTTRGARTLGSADLIVCSDEKSASALLKRHALSRTLLTLDDEMVDDITNEVIRRLDEDERVALLTDPGFEVFPALAALLDRVRATGREPRVIPGVDPVSTILAMSGLPHPLLFVDEPLPDTNADLRNRAEEYSRNRATIVTSGPSERPARAMAALAEADPTRRAVVVFRPTIPGETIIRDTLAGLAESFSERRIKSAWWLVLAPRLGMSAPAPSSDEDRVDRAAEQETSSESKETI